MKRGQPAGTSVQSCSNREKAADLHLCRLVDVLTGTGYNKCDNVNISESASRFR